MQKILEATFKLSNDNKYTMKIENVREDVTNEEISAMMDLIVTKDIISVKGANIVAKDEAKLITLTEEGVTLS